MIILLVFPFNKCIYFVDWFIVFNFLLLNIKLDYFTIDGHAG